MRFPRYTHRILRPGLWASMISLLGLLIGGCSDRQSDHQEDSSTPTFNGDVAPIVFENCSPCHQPGQVAPFSLLTYEDVRERARQIAVVTSTGFMPPWLPEEGRGHFVDERRLTGEQIDTIARWADSGAPEGTGIELRAEPALISGWHLGEPDLVIEMPEAFTVPAEGTDIFRNFILPVPHFERTRFVRGLEMHTDNPTLVHHATMRLDATDQSRRRDAEDPGVGWEGMLSGNAKYPDGHLLGWTPGMTPFLVDADRAWRLEPGTDFVTQLHLLPSGKEERLKAKIGFYFSDQVPTRLPYVLRLGSKTLDIPAGQSDYSIEDRFVLPVAVEVLGIHPHAHYLGKEMKAYALIPAEAEAEPRKEWLIHIKEWDFNWQEDYRYAETVALPAGAEIVVELTFDNSEDNFRNPNRPPQRVIYGPKSSDEMADFWIQVQPVDPADRPALNRAFQQKEIRSSLEASLRWLSETPDDFRLHFEVARQYLTLGDLQSSANHLREAHRLEPREPSVLTYIGLVLIFSGNPGQAISFLNTALEVDPDHPEALLNLGSAQQALGLFDQAADSFERHLELRPSSVEGLNNLGNLHQQQGRLDPAISSYRRALAIRPDAKAYNNLGVALEKKGRLDEALESYRASLNLDPSYASARRNLAGAEKRRAKKP